MSIPLFQIATTEHACAPLSPEALLAAAVVRQALRDLASEDPLIRHSAQTWWQDGPAVRFWDDLLDLDGALVQRAQGLAGAVPASVPSAQLPLWSLEVR